MAPPLHNSKESAWLGSSLTWTAGYVDAVGYLTLYHIYSANMSGNSVSLAINSVQHHWLTAFAYACPILAFFPGLVFGACLVRACKLSHFRSMLMPAMVAEAFLLILYLVSLRYQNAYADFTHPHYGPIYALAVALISFAMGHQNGALREIGGLKNVHTYVTGTMLAGAEAFTDFLFQTYSRLSHSHPSRFSRTLRVAPRQPSLRSAAFSVWLWAFYMVGALLGALLVLHWGVGVILIPALLLCVIAAIDLSSPIGAVELPPVRSNCSNPNALSESV
jgi:uncharacterized membrane protein YoaK (UPF0700 family)